jgi:hypothetical protein
MRRSFSLLLLIAMLFFAVACNRQVTPATQPGSTKPVLPEFPDCRQAELITETIPAGSSFLAGEEFDKTWVIRNTSPCPWDRDYSLVYYQGIGMGESTHLLFTSNLPPEAIITPGDTVTLTLNLRAPFAAGRQVGQWKLRDSAGILFMPNNVSEDAFSVDINVIGTVYSFVDNYCQAVWTLNEQMVACPMSNETSPYRLVINHFPVLEGNNVENEPSIEIHLPEEEGSVMRGVFPAITIRAGDYLHLGAGCADGTPLCNLTFEVEAVNESGRTVLSQWHEISDGKMQSVSLDLSKLANQSIQFIFTLQSESNSSDNRGFWFFPILLSY